MLLAHDAPGSVFENPKASRLKPLQHTDHVPKALSGKFGAYADSMPGTDDPSSHFRHPGRTGDARDYREGE